MPTTPAAARIHPLSAIDTSTLPADGGPVYNRLIFEGSPYLLQHAANPVEWYPWGDAAFARARERDVPVFLSIGYATCHWCHVMEHESFEDREVAGLLNQHFVAIKVDREERPDIDQLYMSVCQLTTGGGGWPLNLLLTPERAPFFAATYIPKQPRAGSYGLLQLLSQVARLWREDRSRLQQGAGEIDAALQRLNAAAAAAPVNDAPLQQALADLRRNHDPVYGGFGAAPKFPSPHQLSLLLRLAVRFQAPEAAEMALTTLRAIARGGIHDQLGGGIHRYSVDAQWLVPHFEKMLYDQALCALAASEAWQFSPEPVFAELTRSVLDYLLTDLRDPLGGFYSGEDADSEGEEGTFYLWTPAQIRAVLDPAAAALVSDYLGVTEAGNFEGRNILWQAQSIATLTEKSGDAAATLGERLHTALTTLHQARANRVRPLLDDKIVCSWNGLTIAALARSGAVLGEARWLEAARFAAEFVLAELATPDGGLLRRWRRGRAAVPGFLEDYAAVVWGLTELHQATFEEHWLDQARRLAGQMIERFDDGTGGLYDCTDSGELTVRPRSWQDGAVPAGASLAVYTLLRLGRLCKDDRLEERGREILARQLGQAQHYPTAATMLLQGLDFALGPVTSIELTGDDRNDDWLKVVHAEWHPNLLLKRSGSADSAAEARICHAEVCLAAVKTPAALRQWLQSTRARQ